jgi:hypothetical protein
VVFWGAQGEKGLCYGGSFELRAPFDPSQLKLTYADCDGWLICNGAEYAGEEICNDDLSTTGKWGENKWIIVGGEEVYEGVDRDDVDAEQEVEEWDAAEALQEVIDEHDFGLDVDAPCWEDDEKTEWIPSRIKPVHLGTYECQVGKVPTWPWPNEILLVWNGKSWQDLDGEKVGKPHAWRGLREPA